MAATGSLTAALWPEAGRILLRCPPTRALIRRNRRGAPSPQEIPMAAKSTKKAAPKKAAKRTTKKTRTKKATPKRTPKAKTTPKKKAVPKAKRASAKTAAPAKAAPSRDRDPRLPKPGGILTRTFKGKEIKVEVLDAGFAYDGKTWRSLSAIAKEVSGTSWNGYLFFSLQKRQEARKGASE